jgi:predicted site-specific integrase-resolvase
VQVGEAAGDLVRDMIGVVISMGACVYGRGGARNRALGAVAAAGNAGVDAAA